MLLRRCCSSFLLPTQLTNLHLLICAIFGAARLQIAYLTRALPVQSGFHHKQKRLLRFLANSCLQPESFFIHLLDAILRIQPALYGLLTVVIDQTDLPMGYQCLVASVPYRRRSLPFAFVVFDDKKIKGSQNQIENQFFALVTNLLKLRSLRPVMLLDRGYADVKIMQLLRRLKAHYVIRIPRNVWLETRDYCGVAAGLNQVGNWLDVYYQKQQREEVNLTSFLGKGRDGQPELIFLVSDLVPERSRKRYRERMDIEEGFKDIKSPLGLNHLRLKVDIAVRIARMLVAVALTVISAAYLYDMAEQESTKVSKHAWQQSFVSLVTLVWRYVWFGGTREAG